MYIPFREQILLIDGAIFMRYPAEVLQEIEKFLGINPYYQSDMFKINKETGLFCLDMNNGCMGIHKGRIHTKVSEEYLRILRNFYQPYDEDLIELTNRTFSWMEQKV